MLDENTRLIEVIVAKQNEGKVRRPTTARPFFPGVRHQNKGGYISQIFDCTFAAG